MKHHIFLSYSRRDTETMKRVKDLFNTAKLTLWTDEGIEPGTRSWKRAIEDAILSTGCLVCILSPDANQSEWVRAEIEFAELQNKPIYLILARGDERTSIPFGFATMQWVDVRQSEGFESKIKNLSDTIKDKLQIKVKPQAPKQNETPPDLLTHLIRMGNLDLYNERYDEAIDHYTKALELDENKASLYLNRGTSYLEKQKYELAFRDFQQAVQIANKNHTAFYRMGLALSNLGRFKEAVDAYSNSIALKPLVKSYFERAYCRVDIEDYEGAIADYTETIKLDRDNEFPHSMSNRGECKFALGDYQGALDDFEQSKTVLGDADREFAEVGALLTRFALGQRDEAVIAFLEMVHNDAKLNDINYLKEHFNWPEAMNIQAQMLLAALEE